VTTGTGIGPKAIDEIVGVSKAYITRVGAGVFPTELFDEDGETMVDLGHEYGVVTGRRRRPGWLDLVALRYAARINSLTGIFLTKLDILSAFDEVKLCNSYMLDGEVITEFPRDQRELARVQPVYETFAGWKLDVTGARHWDDLPAEAQHYIKYIEQAVDTPIRWISVGPERQQLLER
jgi:adenylosuccinate synthase